MATNHGQHTGHATEIAKAVGHRPDEVGWKVARLLGQHAHEWRALIDTLPAGSWARALLARQENG
jgi:hypothetical protein